MNEDGKITVELIIGCVPSREEDCIAGFRWEPPPNCTYEESLCDKCKIPIWLGSRQKALRDKHGYKVMCFHCLLKEHPNATEDNLCVLSKLN